MRGSYYVYALLDPRQSPARAFYVGKGTGTRSEEHLDHPDGSSKWRRIEEIRAIGLEPVVQRLVENLAEDEAYLIEAQLISAFGRETDGGSLTNVALPAGRPRHRYRNLVMPLGAESKAAAGLQLLKDAVLDFVRANPDGVTNADVASMLNLRSDYGGGSKDYLSYSLLGLLMQEHQIIRVPGTRKHRAAGNSRRRG